MGEEGHEDRPVARLAEEAFKEIVQTAAFREEVAEFFEYLPWAIINYEQFCYAEDGQAADDK